MGFLLNGEQLSSPEGTPIPISQRFPYGESLLQSQPRIFKTPCWGFPSLWGDRIIVKGIPHPGGILTSWRVSHILESIPHPGGILTSWHPKHGWVGFHLPWYSGLHVSLSYQVAAGLVSGPSESEGHGDAQSTVLESGLNRHA